MADDSKPASVFSLVERRQADAPKPAWTPEQLVAEFLDEIKAGKVKPSNLMVFWLEETPDGNLRPHRWIANVTRAEEIAFHSLGITRAIEDWRN